MKKIKHIICYSNGIQSASVAIAVVEKYGKENCILLNHGINPKSEPEDITRFGYKIAKYLKMNITYANYREYNCSQLQSIPNQFDVCVEAGSFVNPANRQILCTNRLKTAPFMKWLKEHGYNNSNSIIYYGFTKEEKNREDRRQKIMCSLGFETLYPLRQMDVPSDYYKKTGIPEPEHYQKFNHGNCYGCLKAGKQHWYIIYCNHRNIYFDGIQAEQKIGYSIHKNAYLEDWMQEFERMIQIGIEPTEKIKPQTFWASVRKQLKSYKL